LKSFDLETVTYAAAPSSGRDAGVRDGEDLSG
jgi:hypothetical protein